MRASVPEAGRLDLEWGRASPEAGRERGATVPDGAWVLSPPKSGLPDLGTGFGHRLGHWAADLGQARDLSGEGQGEG